MSHQKEYCKKGPIKQKYRALKKGYGDHDRDSRGKRNS